MSVFVRLVRCERAAAAAEMALVTPLLVLLLAGAVEIGYYFYSEHRLVESVRDAARYVARSNFSSFTTCPASGSQTNFTTADALYLQARNVAKTGNPASANSEHGRLPGWGTSAPDGSDFQMSFTCLSAVTVGGTSTNIDGIWKYTTGGARVLDIEANVPHASIFAVFGIDLPLVLNAHQQAAVVGA